MSTAAGTPAQRAALLIILAAALAFGAVRAVARREATIDARIGPVGTIVVTAREVPAGRTLSADDLAYRTMPVRWAAPRTLTAAEDAIGLRLLIAMPRGTPLLQSSVTSTAQQASAALASGDRVLELVAAGSTRLVRAGSRVDIVAATTSASGAAHTRIIAQAVEVLEVRDAEPSGDVPQVTATLRVNRTEALKLAAADGGDASLRLLPRASWDRGELGAKR